MKFKAKVVVPAAAALLALGAGAFLYLRAPDETDMGDSRIPYAEGVVIMEDKDIPQVEKGKIALRYKYQARSNDGINFSGMLGNDASNSYDLYFDIYADAELKDQIYLSGLVPPGSAIKEFQLKHELPEGTTTAYVSFNQVETDEEGQQALVSQTLVTVDFIVGG